MRFLDNESNLSTKLVDYQRVMFPDVTVCRQQWNTTRGAMSGEQPIEGIPCPAKRKTLTNERKKRDLVDDETRVVHDGFRKLRVLHIQTPDLRQKLDFEEGDRRDTPR
jgi:hypothetical protein